MDIVTKQCHISILNFSYFNLYIHNEQAFGADGKVKTPLEGKWKNPLEEPDSKRNPCSFKYIYMKSILLRITSITKMLFCLK